jgi:hypothetical protein
MLSPESLGHMATPAHGPVCRESLLQIFRRDFVPLEQQGWRVIVPMNFSEGLIAINAIVTLKPAVDNGPNKTGFRSFFDLGNAFLSAILPLLPTRARCWALACCCIYIQLSRFAN